MLDGLDAIDWGALTHAYGTASDLPGMLRELARPDADHVDVLDELTMSVFEFGMLYDATVAVMPFLLELALDPTRADRVGLVSQLAEFGYLDPFGWRQAGDVKPEELCGRTRAVLSAARDKVLRLVDDPDSAVRHAALRLLLVDREHDARTSRLLRQRYRHEPVPLRHGILDVLAKLADRGSAAWFTEIARTDPDPSLRTAAMAAALRAGATAGTPVSDRLRDAAVVLLRESYAEGESGPVESESDSPVATGAMLRELGVALADRVEDRAALLLDLLRAPSVRAGIEAVPVAAAAVRDWRGDHRELVAAIGGQLRREDARLRRRAAETLVWFGGLAAAAADALAHELTELPRTSPADGLGWLRTTESEPPRLGPVLQALVNARDPRALPALAWTLRQPRPPVYLGSRIAGFGSAAAELIPLLLPRLRDPELSEYDRAGLITTVSALGAGPVETTVALLAREPDRHVLEALGRLGPEVSVLAGPLLRSKLGSAIPAHRTAAAGAWWRLHRDEAAIAVLIEQVDSAASPPQAAVRLLGEIGPAAAAAVPSLRRIRDAAREDGGWLTADAAIALLRITGERDEGLPVLSRLWSRRPRLRSTIAECLVELGPDAAAALPLIREELARPNRFFVEGGNPLRLTDIDADERLLRDCHTIVADCGGD